MLPQILRRTLMAISMSVSGEASVIDDTLPGRSLEFSDWLGKNSDLGNRVSRKPLIRMVERRTES